MVAQDSSSPFLQQCPDQYPCFQEPSSLSDAFFLDNRDLNAGLPTALLSCFSLDCGSSGCVILLLKIWRPLQPPSPLGPPYAELPAAPDSLGSLTPSACATPFAQNIPGVHHLAPSYLSFKAKLKQTTFGGSFLSPSSLPFILGQMACSLYYCFNTLASLYHNPKPRYCIALFTWISPSLTCELLKGKEFCLLYNYLYHLRAWNRADVQ